MEPLARLRWPVALSIVAALVTIGMKGTAYALTGSVGLLTDALESVVNLLAAVTAYFALWYASRPADPSHAYGHEKIECFSSGLEGVLIVVAGLGAAAYGVRRLFFPEPLNALELGVGLALAASVVNFVVGDGSVRGVRPTGRNGANPNNPLTLPERAFWAASGYMDGDNTRADGINN